jgi:hypothetical protein
LKRNWEGVVLKVMGAKDFTLEVTGREEITPDFLRVHVRDGGLLERSGLHPTMWIRLWFNDSGKAHQRAYTLVDADPAAGTFSMDFAMHHGVAADWARSVQAGDTIDATVQGSSFAFPQPAPRRIWVVGDPASIPAINSLLDARQLSAAEAPVTAWLEYQHDADPSLRVRTSSQTWSAGFRANATGLRWWRKSAVHSRRKPSPWVKTSSGSHVKHPARVQSSNTCARSSAWTSTASMRWGTGGSRFGCACKASEGFYITQAVPL